MTTSNSIDFAVTGQDIVREALSICGVLGEGEEPNTAQLTSTLFTLNMMMKHWQAEGLNLFAVERLYLFLDMDRESYSLDHFTSLTDPEITRVVDDYRALRTVGSAVSGQSVLTFETGFAQEAWEGAPSVRVGDAVGIATTTDIFWTTVASLTADTLTITGTLTATVDAGTTVFTYGVGTSGGVDNRARRPMKLLEAYIRDERESSVDIPVGVISRRRYDRLSTKSTSGQINQAYYDSQTSSGELFVWPTTNDVSDVLLLVVQRTLHDIDTATNSPDYPQEWFLPLAWGLAELEAAKYGVPASERNYIANRSIVLKNEAMGFDEELYTSLFFGVDSRGEEL